MTRNIDVNKDGWIDWDEFLAYVRQQEAKNPVLHTKRVRRASMGMGKCFRLSVHRVYYPRQNRYIA